MTTRTTVTITKKTRLGYGATSKPERAPGGGMRIEQPREKVSGLTPKTLLDRRAAMLRSVGVVGGGGTSYREAIFVKGRRVVSPDPFFDLNMLVNGLEADLRWEVE